MSLRFDGKHFHLFKFNKHLSKTYRKAPAVLGARKWGRDGCKSAFKRVLVYWKRRSDIVLGSKALWGTDSNTGRAAKQKPAMLFLMRKLALFLFLFNYSKTVDVREFLLGLWPKARWSEDWRSLLLTFTQLNRSSIFYTNVSSRVQSTEYFKFVSLQNSSNSNIHFKIEFKVKDMFTNSCFSHIIVADVLILLKKKIWKTIFKTDFHRR